LKFKYGRRYLTFPSPSPHPPTSSLIIATTAIPEAAEALPGLIEELGPGLAKGGEAAGKEGGSASKGLDAANQGQSAAGEASQGMDLISQITTFVQTQEALAVKAAQDQSNDFNIKSAFMDNTLAGVEKIVGGKYNALIVANSQQGPQTPAIDLVSSTHDFYR
jgi:hypothetical protein